MEYEYKPDIETPFTSDGKPDEDEVDRIVAAQKLDGWSLYNRAVSPNRHGDGRNYTVLMFRKPKA
jgi:hypothetical protein